MGVIHSITRISETHTDIDNDLLEMQAAHNVDSTEFLDIKINPYGTRWLITLVYAGGFEFLKTAAQGITSTISRAFNVARSASDSLGFSLSIAYQVLRVKAASALIGFVSSIARTVYTANRPLGTTSGLSCNVDSVHYGEIE